MMSDRGHNSTENAAPTEPVTGSATRSDRARFDDGENNEAQTQPPVEDDEDDYYSDYDFDPIFYD